MLEMLTSLGDAFAYFASASATLSVGLSGTALAVSVTSAPAIVTVGTRQMRGSRRAFNTSAWVSFTPFLAVNVNEPPALAPGAYWTAAGCTCPHRRERVLDRGDRVGDEMLLHVDALAVHARKRAHLRVGEAERAQQVADVGDVRGLAVRHLHLPRGAALEVDAELQAAGEHEHDAQEQQRAREDRPPPRVLDELEVGALVVEVRRPVPPGHARQVLGRRDGRGHATAPGTSSADAMPTPGSFTSAGRRASTETIGCMKKNARMRSIAVEMPRKSAKPRTELVANR